MGYLRYSQQRCAYAATHMVVLPQEAQPGARAHGYVTGVQDYGVFVGFCGELCGLAPAAELGLPAGQRPSQGFKVGQACPPSPHMMLDVPVC